MDVWVAATTVEGMLAECAEVDNVAEAMTGAMWVAADLAVYTEVETSEAAELVAAVSSGA